MTHGWIAIGSILGGLGVIFGAFGAHALAEKLPARSLEIYQTASHYQMIHALALLAVGILATLGGARVGALQAAGWGFFVGTLIFSGSLYALALTQIRILGAITPIGGVAFIIGWVCLTWAALGGGFSR